MVENVNVHFSVYFSLNLWWFCGVSESGRNSALLPPSRYQTSRCVEGSGIGFCKSSVDREGTNRWEESLHQWGGRVPSKANRNFNLEIVSSPVNSDCHHILKKWLIDKKIEFWKVFSLKFWSKNSVMFFVLENICWTKIFRKNSFAKTSVYPN